MQVNIKAIKYFVNSGISWYGRFADCGSLMIVVRSKHFPEHNCRDHKKMQNESR